MGDFRSLPHGAHIIVDNHLGLQYWLLGFDELLKNRDRGLYVEMVFNNLTHG